MPRRGSPFDNMEVPSNPMGVVSAGPTRPTRVRRINVDGVPCEVTKAAELDRLARTRSKISAYVEALGDYVSSGDTIRVRSSPSQNCGAIVGQVVGVSAVYDAVVERTPHPYITNKLSPDSEDSFLRIQLYILEDHGIFREYSAIIPPRNAAVTRLGIPSVVATNLVAWVSTLQVSNCAHFIHEKDCLNQVYGPVTGRSNTYSIRHGVTFPGRGCEATVSPISASSYRMFGANTGNRSTVVTLSEKRLVALGSMFATVDGLLAKACSSAKSVTAPMNRDIWLYFLNKLLLSQESSVVVNLTAMHRTVNSDLSVGTAFVSVTTESVKVCTRGGLDMLRRLVCNNFGVRPKIENPTRKEWKDTGATRTTTMPTDTVHLLGMLFDPGIDIDMHDDDGPPPPHQQLSYVKFRYNYKFQLCTTSVKSLEIVPSTDRLRAEQLLHEMGLDVDRFFGNVQGNVNANANGNNYGGPVIQRGQFVEYDDDEWQVAHVDIANNRVDLIHRRNRLPNVRVQIDDIII